MFVSVFVLDIPSVLLMFETVGGEARQVKLRIVSHCLDEKSHLLTPVTSAISFCFCFVLFGGSSRAVSLKAENTTVPSVRIHSLREVAWIRGLYERGSRGKKFLDEFPERFCLDGCCRLSVCCSAINVFVTHQLR